MDKQKMSGSDSRFCSSFEEGYWLRAEILEMAFWWVWGSGKCEGGEARWLKSLRQEVQVRLGGGVVCVRISREARRGWLWITVKCQAKFWLYPFSGKMILKISEQGNSWWKQKFRAKYVFLFFISEEVIVENMRTSEIKKKNNKKPLR